MRATDEEVLAKFPYIEEDGWPRSTWIEQHRDKTPSRALAFSKRLKKYKITEEQFDFMFNVMQQGCCAICREHIDRFTCRIDHDHYTGQVRGLVCGRCNTLLGFIESTDSPLSILSRARIYLEAHLLE